MAATGGRGRESPGRRGRYQRAWLRWDLLAGLTTAAVVVPQAVAYASLAGFKAGMGLVIAASQLGKVLGVPVEGDSFFAKVWSALRQLGDANPATVALALGGLAALLALRRWAPRVPGPLVVVVLGIALVGLTDVRTAGWRWSVR